MIHSTNQVTLNNSNSALYNIASALSNPLQDVNSGVLKFVAARVVIFALAFFASYGIVNFLASCYADYKNSQIAAEMVSKFTAKKMVAVEPVPTQETSNEDFEKAMIGVRLEMIKSGSMKESDFTPDQLGITAKSITLESFPMQSATAG